MADTTTKAPEDMTRGELVSEVHRLRRLTGERAEGEPEQILTMGLITGDGTPVVTFVWDEQQGLMTPDEATDFGLGCLEAADAANYDAGVYRALTLPEEEGGPGYDRFEALRMIMAFRRARGYEATASATRSGSFIDMAEDIDED